MRLGESLQNVKNALGGLYNFFLGNNMKKQIICHAKDESLVLKFKKEHNIDLSQIIEYNTRNLPKISYFHENLSCPNHGISIE